MEKAEQVEEAPVPTVPVVDPVREDGEERMQKLTERLALGMEQMTLQAPDHRCNPGPRGPLGNQPADGRRIRAPILEAASTQEWLPVLLQRILRQCRSRKSVALSDEY